MTDTQVFVKDYMDKIIEEIKNNHNKDVAAVMTEKLTRTMTAAYSLWQANLQIMEGLITEEELFNKERHCLNELFLAMREMGLIKL